MRTIIALIFLTLFTTSLSAQNAQHSLAGIWKLTHSKNSRGEVNKVPPLFYKLFDQTGSFSNLSLRETGLTFAHKGKYTLDLNNSTYTETVNKVNELNTQADVAKNSLKITFNEDKSSFTIEGNIQSTNGTFALYEVWTKLDN